VTNLLVKNVDYLSTSANSVSLPLSSGTDAIKENPYFMFSIINRSKAITKTGVRDQLCWRMHKSFNLRQFLSFLCFTLFQRNTGVVQIRAASTSVCWQASAVIISCSCDQPPVHYAAATIFGQNCYRLI